MGNTFKTGNYVNGIFQDASNNIGIGAAPSGTYKLEVTGTAKVSSTLLVSGAATFSSTVDATIFNSTSNAFRFSGSNALSLVTLNSQNVVKVNAAGYWGVQLVGANDKGILIDNTGNVGIGTSSPNYKLQVRTTTDVNMIVTNNGSNLQIGSSNDAGNAAIPINFTATSFTFNNAATFISLANTTSNRAVLADTNGTLSAPVSDISVKQNITPIGYGLNEIMKMNPVWFDFIDEYKNYGVGRQNGNIAQEMEVIIPEAVFTTPSTGKMGIEYSQLHAVYIKAIQEMNQTITSLQDRLSKGGL